MGSRADAMAIIRHQTSTAAFADELARYLAALRYGVVRDRIQQTIDVFEATGASLSANAIQVLSDFVGSPKSDSAQLERVWSALLTKLRDLRALQPFFAHIAAACDALAQHGAPAWALQLRSVPATVEAGSYHTKRLALRLGLGGQSRSPRAHRRVRRTCLAPPGTSQRRKRTPRHICETRQGADILQVRDSMKGTAKAALRAFADIIRRLAGGRGQRAALYRQDSRRAMENCFDAVPCWIMPTWRVSEQLPAAFGAFDLVILDEASQSDARELPALLRGKKILIVGDDRQVSPSAAFLSIASIGRLRDNFLSEFPYRRPSRTRRIPL